MENLNTLRDKAYDCAKKHGLFDKPITRSYQYQRMILISYVAKTLEDYNNSIHVTEELLSVLIKVKDTWEWAKIFEGFVKGTVEDDIAKVLNQLLVYAGMKGTNLEGYQEDLILRISDNDRPITSCYALIAAICSGDQREDDKIRDLVGNVIALAKFHEVDLKLFLSLRMKYNELNPIIYVPAKNDEHNNSQKCVE